MSHKKAGGSTKNGRDSNAKRLGVKLYAGQKVVAGNIIIRQKGNKFFAGQGVDTGKDFTLFALKEGVIQFTEKRQKKYDGRVYRNRFVHVVPAAPKASKVAPKRITKRTVKKEAEMAAK